MNISIFYLSIWTMYNIASSVAPLGYNNLLPFSQRQSPALDLETTPADDIVQAQYQDLPPSNIFRDSILITGEARRNLPGFQGRFRASAVKKLQKFAFGTMFGDDRWKRIVKKLFPPDFKLRFSYGDWNQQLMISNPDFISLEEPTGGEIDFHDQQIFMRFDNIKFHLSFDVGPTRKGKEDYYFSVKQIAQASQLGLECSFVPFINSAGLIQVKFNTLKLINVNSIQLEGMVYNTAWKLFASGGYTFMTKLLRYTEETLPQFLASIVSKVSIEFSKGFMEGIVNGVKRALPEIFKLFAELINIYSLHGTTLGIHPGYISVSTDVSFDLSKIPSTPETPEEVDRYFTHPSPYKAKLPPTGAVNYRDAFKYEKTIGQRIKSKLKKLINK